MTALFLVVRACQPQERISVPSIGAVTGDPVEDISTRLALALAECHALGQALEASGTWRGHGELTRRIGWLSELACGVPQLGAGR
jgi:predicted secreted protein